MMAANNNNNNNSNSSIKYNNNHQNHNCNNEELDGEGNTVRVADLEFIDGILGKGSYGTVRLARMKLNTCSAGGALTTPLGGSGHSSSNSINSNSSRQHPHGGGGAGAKDINNSKHGSLVLDDESEQSIPPSSLASLKTPGSSSSINNNNNNSHTNLSSSFSFGGGGGGGSSWRQDSNRSFSNSFRWRTPPLLRTGSSSEQHEQRYLHRQQRRQRGTSGLERSNSAPASEDFFLQYTSEEMEMFGKKDSFHTHNNNTNLNSSSRSSVASASTPHHHHHHHHQYSKRSSSDTSARSRALERSRSVRIRSRSHDGRDDSINNSNSDDEQLVAVKIFKKSLLKRMRTMERNKQTRKMQIRTALEKVYKEIALMKKLSHPNLVNFFEVIDSPESDMLYMVIEYMPLGEILTYQQDGTFRRKEPKYYQEPLEGLVDGHFDEFHAALYFVDIMHGLAYLHQHGVIHRDLKPENILLDVRGIAKLSDFGVSHIFDEKFLENNSQESDHDLSFSNHNNNNNSSSCLTREDTDEYLNMKPMAHSGLMTKTEGTWAFWSPEMCAGPKAFSGYAADIWAAGVCLYIFVTGKLPFYSEAPSDLFDLIKEAKVEYEGLDLSDNLLELLQMTLQKDPEERAGVGDCLGHPFLLLARAHRIQQLNTELAKSKATNVEVKERDIETAFRIITSMPVILLKNAAMHIHGGIQAARQRLSISGGRSSSEHGTPRDRDHHSHHNHHHNHHHHVHNSGGNGTTLNERFERLSRKSSTRSIETSEEDGEACSVPASPVVGSGGADKGSSSGGGSRRPGGFGKFDETGGFSPILPTMDRQEETDKASRSPLVHPRNTIAENKAAAAMLPEVVPSPHRLNLGYRRPADVPPTIQQGSKEFESSVDLFLEGNDGRSRSHGSINSKSDHSNPGALSPDVKRKKVKTGCDESPDLDMNTENAKLDAAEKSTRKAGQEQQNQRTPSSLSSAPSLSTPLVSLFRTRRASESEDSESNKAETRRRAMVNLFRRRRSSGELEEGGTSDGGGGGGGSGLHRALRFGRKRSDSSIMSRGSDGKGQSSSNEGGSASEGCAADPPSNTVSNAQNSSNERRSAVFPDVFRRTVATAFRRGGSTAGLVNEHGRKNRGNISM